MEKKIMKIKSCVISGQRNLKKIFADFSRKENIYRELQ